MTFPASIVYAEFAADGSTVFILTADQHVYRLRASDSEKGAGMQ
jgi:hypothetical protein